MFNTKLLTNNLLIKFILFTTVVFCLTLLGCSSDSAESTETETFMIPASCCPSWSPDNNRLTYESDRDGNLEVYVSNIDGSNPVNISNNSADDGGAVWSPTSEKIAFLLPKNISVDVVVTPLDIIFTLGPT